MSKRRNRDKKRPAVPQSPSQESERRRLVSAQISQSFSGPLPPPDVLIRYNDAVPDGAERILAMAEEQSAHRMQLENQVITADIRRSYMGVIAGLIVALSFLAVSFILIDGGHEWSGTALATVDIVGLVGVFVYGTISRRREREERARMMAGQSER